MYVSMYVSIYVSMYVTMYLYVCKLSENPLILTAETLRNTKQGTALNLDFQRYKPNVQSFYSALQESTAVYSSTSNVSRRRNSTSVACSAV